MTPITSVEQLIEFLRNNPDSAEELKKALLTDELQGLPSEFKSYTGG